MPDRSKFKFDELRILRAYVLLAFAASGPRGEKSISLARFGNHEVRLVEFPYTAHFRQSLWLELFAHDQQIVLDSASCAVFDEATAMADNFIQQALHLHETS